MSKSDIEEQKNHKFVEGDAGDGTLRETHYLTGVRLIMCLASVLCCLFLCGLDQSIVAPALTVIGNQFDALDRIGWVTSGYFLPSVVLTVAWGRFGLIIGRKYAMLLAVLIFEAGSLMCALANNMDVLIGGRVLAGIGGGGIQNMCFIIINEVTPINKRPLAFATVGAVFTLASVAGPLVGGAFTSNVTWRWCFYINLPLGGVAALFLAYSFRPPLPTGKLIDRLKTLDYFGSFLLAVGLVLFLLGLTFGAENQYPWKSAAVVVNIILGVLFIIAFGIWNFLFCKQPTIPVPFLKEFRVIAAITSVSCTFGMVMSITIYYSVYLENVIGKSPIGAGVSLLPVMIPATICGMATGILSSKTRFVKPFVIGGSIFATVGSGLYCLLGVDASSADRIGLLIVGSMGMGALMQSLNMAGQLSAPAIPMGTIMTATLLVFGRSLGAALSTIISEVIYNTSLRNQLPKAIAGLNDTSILNELSQYDLNSLVANTDLLNHLTPPTKRFVREQILFAVKRVYYFVIAIAGLGLISGLFTTNRRVPRETETNQSAADRAAEKLEEEKTGEKHEENSIDDIDEEKTEGVSGVTPKMTIENE